MNSNYKENSKPSTADATDSSNTESPAPEFNTLAGLVGDENTSQANDDAPSPSSTEQLMELYLEQLEAGQAPDQKTFLARYPEFEKELKGQLEALEFLHFAGPQLSDNADTPPELSRRATLGDFRLVRQIGRGGMGIVYEAEQLSLDRRVAVKVLPFAAMLDSVQMKRFINEARAAATLEHPNIVPIYFVGQERGVHFYAMQLIEGQSLAELLQDLREQDTRAGGPAPSSTSDGNGTESPSKNSSPAKRESYERAAQLALQVANALQHAHEQSVVHRDIKPGNLLVDSSGKLWVADFGLARLEHQESVTANGDVLGTLAYMSPEQLAGAHFADPRSDVYSLGATLFELLTLTRPFAEGQRTLSAAGRLDPPLIRKNHPHIPVDLETIVHKALAPEPDDRYQSAKQMATDLQRFLGGLTIHARRPSTTDRIMKWTRRHQKLFAASVALMAFLVSLLALSSALVWRAQNQTQAALIESRNSIARTEGLLYISDMALAFQAFRNQRVDLVHEILLRQIPEQGKTDHRGIEWNLLWNQTTQPTARNLAWHEGAANQLAIFPDGTRVASVGDSRRLQVANIRTGEVIMDLKVGGDSDEALSSVAVSPDGKTIATGSDIVQLWDARTGRHKKVLAQFDYNVQSIAYSPDGMKISVGTRYDKVSIFDVKGELIATIDDQARHESLEFTPDSRYLLVPSRSATAGGNMVGFIACWKSDGSKLEHEFHVADDETRQDLTIATSAPSGDFFALSARYGKAATRIVDRRSGEVLLRLPAKRDQINATAISADNRILAAAFNDGHLEYWILERTEDGSFNPPDRTHLIDAHFGKVKSVKFAGPHTLISCGEDGLVRRWDLREDQSLKRTGMPGCGAVEVSATGETIAISHANGIQLLTSGTRESSATSIMISGANNLGLALSRDGKLVAGLSNHNFAEVHHAGGDLATKNSLVNRIDLESRPINLDFSPKSNDLAIALYSGDLCVFDPHRKTKLARIELDEVSAGPDQACAYSPDGEFLIAGGMGRELVIVETQTFRIVERLHVGSYTHDIKFSTNGEMLASSHADGTIRIWDWVGREQTAAMVGHSDRVTGLAFSSDNRTIASVSDDSTVRLWSVQYGRQFGILCERESIVRAVAFSSNGGKLYIGHDSVKSDASLSVYEIALPSHIDR